MRVEGNNLFFTTKYFMVVGIYAICAYEDLGNLEWCAPTVQQLRSPTRDCEFKFN